MKKPLLRIYLCLILMPYNAHAQCASNVPFAMNSWHDVVQALQASGIEAGRVNWGPVEQLCQIFRKSSEPNAFNNCRYTKARDSVLFRSDREQCRIQAIALTPDSLLQKTPVQRIQERDKTGVVKQYDVRVKAYTRDELYAERSSNIVSCMQQLGWQDANDWVLGKRCQ